MESLLDYTMCGLLFFYCIGLAVNTYQRVKGNHLKRFILEEYKLKKNRDNRGDLYYLIMNNPKTINELKQNTNALQRFAREYPVISVYEGKGLDQANIMLGNVIIKKIKENDELLRSWIDKIEVIH